MKEVEVGERHIVIVDEVLVGEQESLILGGLLEAGVESFPGVKAFFHLI